MISNDTCRCKGTDNEICKGCLRTSPVLSNTDRYTMFVNPPIDKDGECYYKIPTIVVET